jgi:hypothetical protein
MKKLLIIPIFSYLLAIWVIISIEKHEVCSFCLIFPILIVFVFSYLNEWVLNKVKLKFEKFSLALWSVSNLSLLYTAGSVLFTLLGGNYLISIILLIFGIYDNYKSLKILE